MKRLVLLMLMAFTLPAFAQSENSGRPTTAAFLKAFPYKSIGAWTPGMKFRTEPSSINNFSTELDLVPYKTKRLTAARLQQGDYLGKTFTFVGYEERRDDRCAEANCIKHYLVFECEGNKFEYSSFFTMGALKEYPEASVTNFVYIDEIESVAAALKDKQIYVLDVPWLVDAQTEPVQIAKYLPVQVTDVTPGTQDGPVKISFTISGDETIYHVNTRLSGVNKATGLYGVDFAKAFSFEDPKLSHPKISAAAWHHIQHKKVQLGMTKDECDLAWGKPQKTNSITNGAGITERWFFENNKTLKFVNGIVDAIE